MTSDEGRAVRFVLLALVVCVIIFLVASYFLALFLGPTLFFLTSEGAESSGRLLRALPIRLTWGALFMFLWGVYLTCFVVSWRWRESFHRVIGKALSGSASSVFDNWLFTMAVVASVLLAAFVLITAFQEAVGVRTGAPSLPENRFEAYLNLAYSPLIEEISFRISPIGLFLVVYLFWAGRNAMAAMSLWQRVKLFFAAFLYPEKAKRIVGVRTVATSGLRGGVSLGEWVMVLVTAVIFGLMHFIVDIGWGPGKITTAFMNGFVFGLVYLAYGFQAPILLHWFLNYYFYTYTLAAEFCPSVSSLVVVVEPLNLFFGFFALLSFVILALKRMSKTASETKPLEPGPSL